MKTCNILRLGLLTGFALAATLVIAAAPAHAQEAKLIGTFGDWEAYIRGGKDDRFCYIVSKPKEASLRSRRGDIFLLVWHRPAKREFDVVQIDSGYDFKKDSEVEIKIGGAEWRLFTRDSNAWTYKGDDDANIVKAMRKGSRLIVKGTSGRNNPTTDRYSLKGVTAAHRAMNKACGRK